MKPPSLPPMGRIPALSFGGDDEALDLGTFVPPYGARIAVEKIASEAYAMRR